MVSGCSLSFDLTNEAGRAAIVRAAKNALTGGDCTTAIQLIEPLYNSSYVTNEIRLVRASAHGCAAGVNFLQLAMDLANSSGLSGAQFFKNMTQYFPSTLGSDSAFESGMLAIDALQAAIIPGRTVNSIYAINSGTFNVGSLLTGDRIPDANFYLLFIGMSQMGAAQNRYGAPDATYQKTVDLPWRTSATVTTDGCAYASGLVNMADAMSVSANYATGALATTLSQLGAGFTALADASCNLGCMGLEITLASANDPPCAYANNVCNPCPTTLRTRTGCQSDIKAACAAAGIVRVINDDPVNGWPPDL